MSLIPDKMKKQMKYLFLSLCFVLFVSTSNAQQDVSVSKKDFKSEKPGFSQAWGFLKDGDSYYSRQGVWYESALQEYLQAYSYDSRNAELNYKMGVCCLYSDSKEDALDYFLKALGNR